jgi:hypothetical protein
MTKGRAIIAAALAAFTFLPPLPAAAGRRDETVYKFQEKEEIRNVLKFQDVSRPGTLLVDNVFGSISVEAADRQDIELAAVRTIRAKTKDKLDRAKAEVKLDLKGVGTDIDVYVDGPFRCQVDGCKGLRWRDWGYEVRYDFVLKVPRRTSVVLKTVNDGDIIVRGVEGDFDVSNVNGRVTLEAVAGAGEAHTVNGKVRAAFRRNPAEACSFETVNGDVELVFASGLAADIRLKSMNGEAFSDFTVTPLPAEAVKREVEDGRTVFKRGGYTGVRAGKGGPEIRCETLNGDIFIKKS